MSSPVLNLSSSLVECPKCSRNAIVNHQVGKYHCLNCNFERNLTVENAADTTKNSFGELVFGLVGIIVTALLIL